jgi:TetR/AcrR family transcriptional regulator, transcriptional repressor for nem operon
MGYSSGHKARTRERVVEAAARLFRRYGYNGVGIDDIMAAAGMTRGGFYAHFRSKQELFAAALGEESELARRLRSGGAGDAEQPSGSARALIEFYLGAADRALVTSLCPLVSLSVDVARGDAQASAAYTETLRDLVGEIARRIPAPPEDARQRALAAVALCVGAAVLGHAVSDERLAAELSSTCRERALNELERGAP